ncbi:type IV secretion system protein [Variovorax sp. J22P168]|uniref:type IV secretion system protein n=1 Tax=Variovorax jilinensis TaxID=3053513 RepID=UPI0025765E0A|nr:type IV secretion system protein [Variovorax sp. J22P168]MDM0015046.1 type IV secretion system protein [Variovorax sp. J22P168]
MADITIQGMIGASDGVAQTFLSTTYPALASAVATPVHLAAVLYWALFGYKIYAGHSPLQWKDFLARAFMTMAVFGTLNWGGFAQDIYRIFFSFADSAASTIMAGQPTGQMLDALWVNADTVSGTLRNAKLTEITLIFDGLVLFVVNCLLFVIALAYMTLAKWGMAITMVLLPLFAGFALFEQTRHFATNWINVMLNCCFVYILVVAIVRFGFIAFGDAIEEAGKAAASSISLPSMPQAPGLTEAASYFGSNSLRTRQTSQLVLIEGVLILFMLCVRGWASALAGGASGSTGTLIMIARTAMSAGTGGAARAARASSAARGGVKK